MLDQIRRNLAPYFRGYYGLKRFLIFVTVLWSAAVLVLIYWKHGFVPITGLYVVFYRTSQGRQLLELAILAALLFVILQTDSFKREFTRYFGYCEHLEPAIYRKPPGWRASLLTLGCLCVCLPYADLYSAGVEQYFLKYSSPLLMVLRLLLNKTGMQRSKYIERLSTFRFDRQYFNPAGLGAKSVELDAAVGRIKYRQQPGRDSGQGIIAGVEDSEWKGVKHLIGRLANYTGCAHPDWITLHEQTTDAVHFAIEEVWVSLRDSGKEARILYTDAEYPGLVDHTLRKLESQGRARLGCAAILGEILKSGDTGEIADRIADEARRLNANVLLLSHVIFSVGYVVDVEAVVRRLEQVGLNPIVVVDGAQAVGNVRKLDPELNSVDYYAACTQKWLCTNHNLGVLVRNRTQLKGKGIECGDSPRPFSSLKCEEEMFCPTIAIQPYYELAVLLEREFQDSARRLAISEHNVQLANVFEAEIRQFGYEPIGRRVPNGILAIKLDKDRADALEARLAEAGIQCAKIPLPTEDDTWVLRFSFHFYHDSYDLFELIKVLGNEWRMQETARGRKGFVSASMGKASAVITPGG